MKGGEFAFVISAAGIAAGALSVANAGIMNLVVAVDDPVKSLSIVETAQKQFPELKIVARAVDRNHAYQLMNKGVMALPRETFHSALEQEDGKPVR